MPGDVGDGHALASAGEGKEVKEVAADDLCRSAEGGDLKVGEVWRLLGQERALYSPGQLEFILKAAPFFVREVFDAHAGGVVHLDEA